MTLTFHLVPSDFKRNISGGAWVAQSVKGPTSAQVMISQVVSLSPMSGSVLTARSLEPASDSLSPSVSHPPLLTLSLAFSKINTTFKKRKKETFLSVAKSRGPWAPCLLPCGLVPCTLTSMPSDSLLQTPGLPAGALRADWCPGPETPS